jgi:pyruvate dehydrogenase E1 component alpha subunit
MASAMGIKSFHTSSSNPIKLLEDLKKIIDKNQLPVFIEVDTYRYLEHCGPNYDDYLKYRPKNEVKYWSSKDSLVLVENFIKKKNICSLQLLNKIKNKINKSINRAFKFAEKSEYPKYNKFLKMKL